MKINLPKIAARAVETFVAIAAAIAFGVAMFGLGKATAHNDTAWDALFNTPPAPALDVTDEFLMEFVEGKIDLEMIEAFGEGINDDE